MLYLVHRLVLEIPATYFDLSAENPATTYILTAVLLVLLYPLSRWYRTLKAAHPQTLLRYF